MLSQKVKDFLAGLKIDPEKLIAAVKDEKEVEIDLPEGHLFTDDDLAKRDAATKKTGYDEGKKVGEEKLIGAIRKEESLEFTGETKENLVKAIKAKYEGEKGKEVDQKIKDRDKIIEGLKESLATKETELATTVEQFSSFKSDFEFVQLLPDNRNPALSTQEWVFRLKSAGVKIDEQDGKKVLRVGEDLVLDEKTKNPLPVADAIGNIFKAKQGWLKEELPGKGKVGTGFKDNTGNAGTGVFKNKSEFDKAMAEQGISFTNEKYQQELTAAVKANPEMSMAE